MRDCFDPEIDAGVEDNRRIVTESDANMSADTARLSILIPCFNAEPFLSETIDSALGQMDLDDELIVQDAVSTDGGLERLRAVALRDPRVKVISEKDAGQSDALNRALDRATGEWVLWLNADDVLLEGAIEALRTAIRDSPESSVIVGGHQIIRADGSIVDHFRANPLRVDWMIYHGCAAFSGSILARTQLLRAIGGFDNDLHTVMDLSLQFRLGVAEPRQVIIEDEIGALRFHDTSKSANLWSEFIRESHSIRSQYAPTLGSKMRASLATVSHAVAMMVFRLRLTPEYRRLRARVANKS